MRIAKSVAELIGRTPMLELTHFEQMHCLNAHLLAKVESFNPGGSVKDRIALGMVEAPAAPLLSLPAATPASGWRWSPPRADIPPSSSCRTA